MNTTHATNNTTTHATNEGHTMNTTTNALAAALRACMPHVTADATDPDIAGPARQALQSARVALAEFAANANNEAAHYSQALAPGVEDNTSAPDPARAFTGLAPFRVAPGRGIVDATGRLIANAHARRMMDRDGYMREVYEDNNGTPTGALSPCEADSNAHAIARALNADALQRGGVRQAPTLGDRYTGHDEAGRLLCARPGDAPGVDAMRQALRVIVDTMPGLHVAEGAARDYLLTTARDALAAGDAAPRVDLGPLDALRANMRHAVRTRDAATIGGGIFSADEMAEILATLDALRGVQS